MLPELTKYWIDVVGLHVDLALCRARSEAVDEARRHAVANTLEAMSRRTCDVDALVSGLRRRLGLSLEEELVAWTLAATQLEPSIASRLEALSGGPEGTKGALTAIAYTSHPARAVDELGLSGALMRFGLIEHVDHVNVSWARRAVRATDCLLSLALLGASSLAPACAYVRTRASRARDELALADATSRALEDAMRGGAMVALVGLPSSGKRTALATFARDAGIEVLEVDATKLADDVDGLSRDVRAVVRECRLSARAPLIGNLDALAAKPQHLAIVQNELAVDGPVFATMTHAINGFATNRPIVIVDMQPPTSKRRAALWLEALGSGTPADGELLADQYPIAAGLIGRAADAAKARAVGRELTPGDIAAGVRVTLDDRLGRYAQRVTVTQTWDDLVLPQDQLDTVAELIARVRERRRVYEDWGFAAKVGKGLGVAALFSGPPGTGKTMVASLIARELGLELYRVDLANVVSKWLGETEKQLSGLFDAAEAGHAILLFDEADSLFGKRTDVRTSNDRYANLETNYLLQRLETFTGVCLLTSNHESSIDPAFLRRLSLHVRFETPEQSERENLWRAMLPQSAPRDQIDFALLARRYEMTGGYIRNATLRAAFFAADRREPISQRHLDLAARLEYEAIGKIASA